MRLRLRRIIFVYTENWSSLHPFTVVLELYNYIYEKWSQRLYTLLNMQHTNICAGVIKSWILKALRQECIVCAVKRSPMLRPCWYTAEAWLKPWHIHTNVHEICGICCREGCVWARSNYELSTAMPYVEMILFYETNERLHFNIWEYWGPYCVINMFVFKESVRYLRTCYW